MVDNITIYIDNYITGRSSKREWCQYVPKVKEGKKPLPKKYHYFRRRLYNNKRNSFLLLSLRYDDTKDIFRLRINGSVKKWYLNGNTLEDLTKPQYEDCIKTIAEKIATPYSELLNSRNTKIETGFTICLKAKFTDLLKNFVWYKNFERIEEDETTIYFRGEYYSFILYEKNIEIKSKNRTVKNDCIATEKPINFTKSYLRFEVKVNRICGVTFYKEKANTTNKVITNWNEIVQQIQTYFKDIEFLDLDVNIDNPENITFSELKKYLIFIGIKFFGLEKVLELFNKINTGTNKTKYRNEIFSLIRSFTPPNIVLREELLCEFESKINTLSYNKHNSYSYYNKEIKQIEDKLK
ncbi:hypothetical protein [uncultured Flavobacterium sp.]|uniref:hypothetical protein n=1 Tax=uncultured Flavobacterium sp. TaxID=165435 RepID=UPI0025E8B329|nr:hypothetical protein [uncultured Flavobacterium sp.]